jgi:hypothetical protein
VPRQLNRKRNVTSTNGVGTIDYPHARKIDLTLLHREKLIQNGSKT